MAGDGDGEIVKAHVSTIWVPYVLIIFMVCPAGRWVAVPWAAGIVCWVSILEVLVWGREIKRGDKLKLWLRLRLKLMIDRPTGT